MDIIDLRHIPILMPSYEMNDGRFNFSVNVCCSDYISILFGCKINDSVEKCGNLFAISFL